MLFDKDKFVPARLFRISVKEVNKLYWLAQSCLTELRNCAPPKMEINSHRPEQVIAFGKCKGWLRSTQFAIILSERKVKR